MYIIVDTSTQYTNNDKYIIIDTSTLIGTNMCMLQPLIYQRYVHFHYTQYT